MIRWYDAIAAILVARFMYDAFFFPTIGPFVSYTIYELWINLYCAWRKDQEKF